MPKSSPDAVSAMPPVAGIGRRFVALLIDWFVALFTASLVTGSPAFGVGAVSGWWTLLAFWIEVSLLDATLGFSIGKRIVGICVIGPNLRPIGLRAFLRTALILVIVPPLIQNNEGRGFHDVVAQSVITPMRPRKTA